MSGLRRSLGGQAPDFLGGGTRASVVPVKAVEIGRERSGQGCWVIRQAEKPLDRLRDADDPVEVQTWIFQPVDPNLLGRNVSEADLVVAVGCMVDGALTGMGI